MYIYNGTIKKNSLKGSWKNLEAQLGEEPLGLSESVLVLEDSLDGVSGVGLLGWLETFNSDGVSELVERGFLTGFEIDMIDRLIVSPPNHCNRLYIPSWHDVRIVDNLDEWLDGDSLENLLLGHLSDDSTWVLADTGDESVSVWTLLGGIIEGENKSLSAVNEVKKDETIEVRVSGMHRMCDIDRGAHSVESIERDVIHFKHHEPSLQTSTEKQNFFSKNHFSIVADEK
ncbi:hypothetical protein DFA_01722 [Cavenderia fasciculata]|uniref:Uncharacterized protein n=1 Tax=Cavenderia fasciculata TaxID=261658 RepID=F4PUC1_CACFS|nr:uncharacterized protein DFA_01722 [Cavenderia fasciculata]EGG21836.1 hypothetical protein DFA_01722 [Cavenderia fasciculata]|eukprot:XP_004359686.1 hypothetical protein DFA_01722 [Cavenderia fasciculata]